MGCLFTDWRSWSVSRYVPTLHRSRPGHHLRRLPDAQAVIRRAGAAEGRKLGDDEPAVAAQREGHRRPAGAHRAQAVEQEPGLAVRPAGDGVGQSHLAALEVAAAGAQQAQPESGREREEAQEPHGVSPEQFDKWDDDYAAAMRRVHHVFPDDHDIMALLVEALRKADDDRAQLAYLRTEGA